MAGGAIYVPQYDPWGGLRQGILQLAMGYSRGLEKQDLSSQIAQLMANLPGTREKQTLFPMAMNQEGGAPAPGEGISPSGGVDIGTPAAPAIVEQVPEPFDLQKVMGGITDPNLAMGILPTMMNYDSESKRMAAAEKLAGMREAFEQAKLDNEPVKITAWKKSGNEYQPFTVTVKRKNVPEVEARFQEKGYYVGETPKAIPRGPETWKVTRLPNGRFAQVSSTGEMKSLPGEEGSGEKEQLDINAKKISNLKQANDADLRPYRDKSPEGLFMDAPEDAYRKLSDKVAEVRAWEKKGNQLTKEMRAAIERLSRVNSRLEKIKSLGESSAPATGQLIPNADGTYTFR